MGVFTEDVSLNVENVEESQIYAVFEPVEYTAILGESAAIQVPEAINYIKSGQAEINEVVQARTQEFNQNATDKTNSFNANATDKTNNFNLNATNKTEDFNQNASDKTGDFNSNASDKTGDFNLNATSKTNDFNTNATNKTNDFNNNYVEKKGLIDAEVSEAEAFSDLAKQWAVGEPTEPTGYSAKYWAEQAEAELSGLSGRVSTIEGKIPSTATSSNQLTDKSYVDNMDIDLQRQIDALVVSSDVFDIVGTYAELQAYDISTVPVNDIIKVLVDSTHSGAATYYRCVETGGVKSWSYIGSEGAYYTKSEADSLFATPSDIGNATITITQGGVSKGTFTTNQSGNATIDVDAATIPSNMVTTDTVQTITERKNFKPDNGLVVVNQNLTKGTNPSATEYMNVSFMENNGIDYRNRFGVFETCVYSNGDVEAILRAYKNVAQGTATASITVTYPATGNPYATCPTPTEDTTSSTQMDTVGARNTKLNSLIPNLYATSTSAADATEKAVSIPSITTLSAGQIIIVKPTITSTVANSTIKLNNFTAYPMRYNNGAITTSTDSIVWNSAYPTVWLFDGTYWVFITHGVDSNTTYSAMSVSEGTTGTATSQRTMRADYLKQILDNRIQQVNSLPASPVSNILYCIPES